MSSKLIVPSPSLNLPVPTRQECEEVLNVQLAAIPEMLKMTQYDPNWVRRNQRVFAWMLKHLPQIKCAGEE